MGPFGKYASSPLILVNDEVCQECNGELGRLDEELLNQLAILRAFWNRSTTRTGRPLVTTLPGVRIVRDGAALGFYVSIDGSGFSSAEGHHVEGPDPDGVSGLTLVRRGDALVARIRQRSVLNKRVLRAVHKIAFEMVCFQAGHDQVLSSNYNDLRTFILSGRGHWTIGLEQSEVPALADGLPMPPRIIVQPINSVRYHVKIWLGQWLHVEVGRTPRQHWPELITIDPRAGATSMDLSFDVETRISSEPRTGSYHLP